jgi:hypothetical protein
MRKIFIISMSVFSVSTWAQTNTFGTKDPNYINKMYKEIDDSINKRVRQIYDLPKTRYGCYYAPDPYNHAKDWSNPPLKEKKVQKIIESGISLFKSTFSESLKNNPALIEELEGKLAAIKAKSCRNTPNKCLVEIYSTIETYGRFLKPNLGEDYSYWDPVKTCGKKRGKRGSKKFQKWANCDFKVLNHNEKVAQNKYYMDSYKKILEEQIINGTNFDLAAKSYFEKDYQNLNRFGGSLLNLAQSKSGKINKGIGALYLTLEEEGKKVQEKMEIFWNSLVNIVNPQAGCPISGKRIGEFPYPKRVALEGIPAFGFTSDDNFDNSCFTEEKLLSTDFVRADQDAGKSELSSNESEMFKSKLNEIIKSKQDQGYTVTGVQVIGVASKAWSSVKDEKSAKSKNLFLASQRENVAKELISGFKIDGIQITTGHELAGPGYTQSKDLPLAKLDLSDKNIEVMYNQLINDNGVNHLYYVGINSLDDYKKFLKESNEQASNNPNDKGVNNIYQLKYRPFQGFKIVIKGHKSNKVPCNEYGKSTGTSSNKNSGSKVIKE